MLKKKNLPPARPVPPWRISTRFSWLPTAARNINGTITETPKSRGTMKNNDSLCFVFSLPVALPRVHLESDRCTWSRLFSFVARDSLWISDRTEFLGWICGRAIAAFCRSWGCWVSCWWLAFRKLLPRVDPHSLTRQFYLFVLCFQSPRAIEFS